MILLLILNLMGSSESSTNTSALLSLIKGLLKREKALLEKSDYLLNFIEKAVDESHNSEEVLTDLAAILYDRSL